MTTPLPDDERPAEITPQILLRAYAVGMFPMSEGADDPTLFWVDPDMFHRATDASKVALMHLAARLRAGGFRLLDTQFITPHLATLGAVEMPRDAYHVMLDDAIGRSADFFIWPKGTHVPGQKILDILKD